MTQDVQCVATTHSGSRCRNQAQEGSQFCYIHREMAAAPAEPDAAASAQQREQVEAVAKQLNKLADEVQKRDPAYCPPPFSGEALIALLKSSGERLAAFVPTDLVKDIIHNLEGTKPEDLLDPETWKGLWYILNYTLELRAKELLEEIAKRLSAIPGMDLMIQFTASVIESPRDLLDVETWKGGAVVLNAAVQAQLSEVRRLVFGGAQEAEQ
jgi:hypothetical protein